MQETQETWVRSLGREDPLEKEMATHVSILAWEIPRTEEPGRLQSTGSQSRTSLQNTTARVRSQYTHIYVQIEYNIMFNVTKCSLVTNTTVAETALISRCLWSHLFQYKLEMTLHYVRMYCIYAI